MTLSFIIPCYRSEKTLNTVVDEIQLTMEQYEEYQYEIILVCDHSPDNVFEIILQLCNTCENIKGINMSKNFGQHAALMAGYRIAQGDIVISLDDDGQTPVDELPKLLIKLEEGFDIVFGKYTSKKHSLFRNIGSKSNDLMTQFLLNKPSGLYLSSFFVAKKYIIDEICRYENSYPYIVGLLLRTTNNIANVNVCHRERAEGVSGYTFRTLLKLWLNGFTAFSVKPLRIASFMGFICAFLGFISGVFVIISRLQNPDMVAGYSSLMAVLLFVGGMIMMMLGLIGEYIGRIYICMNNAPQYVIRDTMNLHTENEKKNENK